jgi:hypothetical protein
VFEGWLKTGWVGDPRETWLVADEDGVAGWYRVLGQPVRSWELPTARAQP